MSFNSGVARPVVEPRGRLTAFPATGTLHAGVVILAFLAVATISRGAEELASSKAPLARDPLVATKAAYDQAIEEGKGPERTLAEIRRDMAETYRRLTEENRSLQLQQADYERNDPIAKGLREKLVALEKELHQVRASLRSRLDAIEGIRVIEEKRQSLIRQVELLKKQERALAKRMAEKNGS